MRFVRRAIWTWGEPVSLSCCRNCCVTSVVFVSVSIKCEGSILSHDGIVKDGNSVNQRAACKPSFVPAIGGGWSSI